MIIHTIIVALLGMLVGHTAAQPPEPEPPKLVEEAPRALFLVDDQRLAQVSIEWPTRDGKTTQLRGERAYLAPNDRTPIGANLECFAAMGGTRLDKGAGHPDGAILRIGFYKTDNKRLMFDNLADDAVVTITMRGVYFTRPGTPRPETVIQHFKYLPEDLATCGIDDTKVDLWNIASKTDDLNGRLTPENTRFDAFSGPPNGSLETTAEPDGSVSVVARIPYRLFRHPKDPWLSTVPGAFLEPNHFHVEIEVLPTDVAESLGDNPPPTLPKSQKPRPRPRTDPD